MTETASNAPTATPRGHGGSADRLGPFLCWAVVFADIGTSVYYVPGILYSQVGRLAGVFVTMTLIVFLLLIETGFSPSQAAGFHPSTVRHVAT
jgi:hypothetical protein